MTAKQLQGTYAPDGSFYVTMTDGSGNLSPTPPNTFVVSPATDAGIRAARTAALAAGGGTIYLPAGTIALNSTIPLDTNIKYIGVQPTLNFPVNAPDEAWTFSGGTVLTGSGFPAFSANTASKSSPDFPFPDNAVNGCGLKNIGFSGFTSAISAGNKNNISVTYSIFEDLWILNTTGFGIDLYNFHHIKTSRIYCMNCAHGIHFAMYLDQNILQGGNSTIEDLFINTTNQPLARGLVLEAIGYNDGTNHPAILDLITFIRPQVDHFGRTQIVQAASTTNTSSSITVTDSTKFQVGLPVHFTSAVNGLTAVQNKAYSVTYVVKSIIDSTHITVGLGNQSATFVANATGSVGNITSWGTPNIEIIGTGVSTSTVNSCNFISADLEGSAEAVVYIEGGTVNQVQCNSLSVSSVVGAHIVCRNTSPNNEFICNTSATTDLDGTSFNLKIEAVAIDAHLQYSGIGFYQDHSRNTYGFNWLPKLGDTFDIEARFNVGFWNYPVVGFGETVTQLDITSALPGFLAGLLVSNPGGAITFTLPTIITDNPPPSGDYQQSVVGLRFHIRNTSASTITLNTDGVQTFNNIAAKTSTTIGANAGVIVTAARNNAGTLFWEGYSLPALA